MGLPNRPASLFARDNAGPAGCCAGSVYVERRPASAPKEDRAAAEPLMFSSEGSLPADRPAAEPGVAPWGIYSSAQSVDSLIAYLNPQGQRESTLKRVRHTSSASLHPL